MYLNYRAHMHFSLNKSSHFDWRMPAEIILKVCKHTIKYNEK